MLFRSVPLNRAIEGMSNKEYDREGAATDRLPQARHMVDRRKGAKFGRDYRALNPVELVRIGGFGR